ncbi:putative polygalacturonase, partial [Cucurbita argyrosperma subsp. sororia]
MKLFVSFVFLFFIVVLSSLTESASSYFNVLDYGADGNGKTDDSELGGIVMAPSKDEWSSDGVDKWIQFYDIDSLTVKGDGQFDGQDIHITAPNESPNTDGIDISGSKNVRILDSFIGTGDDCIAINDGSSNIDIIGLTCGPGHGISIGSLGKNGDYNVVENVYVSECILQDTQNGVRIKTWEGGYGYAKNITFEKITLENVKNPIIIDQHYTAYAYGRKNKGREIKVSDVTYRDVHGTSANEKAITLDCSRARCTNIIMEEVNITTSTSDEEAKSFCQNADGESTSTVPPVPCLSKSH